MAQTSKLLSLPVELRLIIYGHLFEQNHTAPERDHETATSLIYTNRQIFTEVVPYMPKMLAMQLELLKENDRGAVHPRRKLWAISIVIATS